MKYQAKIVLENKNNSHTLAFDRIQQISNGRKLDILEVGCSTGYFGEALIAHKHQVWGVEPNAIAAEQARKLLAYVHTGYIEDFFENHNHARFDVIVFGDVLEHLVDPAQVLANCKNHLKSDGRVVASIPNVAHIAIRAMLLEGRWDYSDLGILDRTHLKFFTCTSLIKLFADAGYEVKSIDPVRISAEQVDELCKLNLSRESIATAARFAKDTHGYDFQYVVTAKPAAADIYNAAENTENPGVEGLRIVCLVHAAESSLVDIRLRNPLNRWTTQQGGSVRIVSIFEHTMHDLDWGDVFIFQRDSSEYAISVIRQLKAAGKKVVFEIDDLLLKLPPFLAHHQPAIKKNGQFIIAALRAADAVSVSTPELAEQIASYNKKIVITPNYSESLAVTSRQFDAKPEKIKLIVASSDKVLIEFIVEPLRQIQEEFGTEIIGIGPPSKTLTDCGISTRHVENMPHKEFKAFLASLDNTIGIIPLDASLFSSCKSAVKYFDYATAGIPVICSNVLPYKAHLQSEVTGILAENTTQDWYQAIKKLILSTERRSVIAANAKHYVQQNCNLDASAGAWQELIESLNVDIEKRHLKKISPLSNRWQFLKSVKWVARHLFRFASYVKAYSTYKNHGLSGLVRRLKRV